jgi:sugar/nucleoside kinase (ribokinase family)
MTKRYDVFIVGDATIDYIFTNLPHLPRMGEDTVAKGFQLIPGETYNTAVAMHRLGIKTAWAASFGNDPFSTMILDFIHGEGLDESFFVHLDRPYRRLSVAASLPDERGFLTYYDPEPTIPAAVSALPRVNARYIFVPGLLYGKLFDAVLPLIRIKKMDIIMDGNTSDPVTLENKSVVKAIRQVKIFLPNKKEILRLTGRQDVESAIKAVAEFCPLVVVKAGCEGSYAYDGKTMFRQPAIPVKVVDTTGAGDSFDAGFIRAYLDQKTIDDCLLWGNIAAGLSTQWYGCTGIKVTRETIDEAINKYQESAK